MALGFSLHLRAEEAIEKFQREIEDDFNYLHEILAEAKQHFGRRDSNILLPKTPSMKRKRQESEEENSSDDNVLKTTKGIKAPKMQGCASPLTVINEGEILDCSVTNEESQENGAKRATRATRAGNQAKRQQPKRGPRKKNVSDVGSENEDSSSLDEKPRRTTRNSRKKNLDSESLVEEKGASSSNDENKRPTRSTRNTRKKLLEDTVEVSSTEELPSQPSKKKTKSSIGQKLDTSEETLAAVVVKEEPVSPVEEVPPLRRSLRNSNSRKEEETKTENNVHIPETPDPPTNVTKDVMSPPASVKSCKATVHLVLQSPGFNVGKINGMTPVTTSSPSVERGLKSHRATVEEIVQPEEKEIADNNVVTITSPVSSLPQESPESCKNESLVSEDKEDFNAQEKVNHNENKTNSEKNCDAADGITNETRQDVDQENTVKANSQVKSGRRSMQRNSGWRRKSRRSSHKLSPANRRLSVKKAVTKSKAHGKKSLVKSSVKLKLTHSKLMPELKMNGTGQVIDEQISDPSLEGVRVWLFDCLTSNSSASASSATSDSSCGSIEDKVDAPVEKHLEEVVEDDAEEVFHDCRSENEADDENENEQGANINSNNSPTVENATSPVVAVRASQGSSSSDGSAPDSGVPLEEPRTPPLPEKQEAVNPSHKAKPNNIALVHSFIRRNTPKKVDPEEKKKQLRIALKEKEEKEKERREQLELQKQREIEERKRRREERAKKAAEQRAAKLQALEEKKRQAQDQRQTMEEKAKKLKEKEDEEKKKQRIQKRAELEARRKQEEAARQQRKREQEEEEKRQREALQKKQELEEQERQRKIAEAKRHQEHREKELEKERELEKQRKLKAIEEKEKRLREKEEKEKKSREEKQRIEREKEERERARIAQLIREKEEAVRREREERAREEKERQEREKRLKEEREAALREKKRQEEKERERIRAFEERNLASENLKSTASCDSYEMTPPPVKVQKPSTQENYNIADLNSDDSTDDEDNPRKKIPAWARPPALTAAIFKQAFSNIDVNSIFDNVPAPNLDAIFTKNKKRYNHRTSSAIWNSPPMRPVKKGTYL